MAPAVPVGTVAKVVRRYTRTDSYRRKAPRFQGEKGPSMTSVAATRAAIEADRRDDDMARASASYWQTCPDDVSFVADRGVPTSADFAVIGGGFAGLATAIQLKSARADTVVAVFEAKFVGYGASGRNAGLMSPLPAPIWLASAAYRDDHGWALKRLNDEVHETARWIEHSIGCAELEHCKLKLEAKGALTSAGLATVGETLDKAGIDFSAQLDGQGSLSSLEVGAYTVHPFKLVRGLANYAQRLGVIICENSPVAELDAHGDGAKVILDDGQFVAAKRVVIATNAYTTAKLTGEAVPAKVVHNYMMSTARSEAFVAAMPEHMPFVVELNKAYVFYRQHAGRLIYGGIDKFGEPGGGPFDVPGKIHRRLKELLRASFSQRCVPEVVQAWGGKFHATATELPVIRPAKNKSGVILNVGYGGTGVALTLICAKFAAAQALESNTLSGDDARLFRIMKETRLPIWHGVQFVAAVARKLFGQLRHRRALPEAKGKPL